MVSSVIATLFLRTTLNASSLSDGQTYLGLIFFAIIHMVTYRSYTSIACSPGVLILLVFNCHYKMVTLDSTLTILSNTVAYLAEVKLCSVGVRSCKHVLLVVQMFNAYSEMSIMVGTLPGAPLVFAAFSTLVDICLQMLTWSHILYCARAYGYPYIDSVLHRPPFIATTNDVHML